MKMISYPAIFIGHGSPMNAIEKNEFSLEWEKIGTFLPRPKSIVCISAHWTALETYVTAMDEPRTIHDFYGFPEELSQFQYPAPGDPVLAKEICRLSQEKIKLDQKWGLDHGCWSVLNRMFPDADIPVVQISINTNLSPRQHFELAHQLKFLRERNVLVIATGNIVHNLREIIWDDKAHPWAISFDAAVKEKIIHHDFESLFHYQKLEAVNLAVPTPEHFLPLFYILGMTNPESELSFFCEKVTMGAISMRSIIVNN